MLLHATPAQMGVLSAVGSGSTLVFGLFAGVLVDRMLRRPLLIWSDIARAILLWTVPVAAAFHHLTFVHLLVVAATCGVVTVFFNVAYQSYLPSFVDETKLFEGNRLVGISSAGAGVIGPVLGGVLIKAVTAPIAILLDAASFVISAISVAAIRRPERARPFQPQTDWRDEALAGGQAIQRNPMLFALAMRSVTAYFFGGIMAALYMLYAITILHMSTVALGVTIAVGGAGSVAGSYFAERLAQRWGTRRIFFLSALVTGLLNLLIPMSTLYPSRAVIFLSAAQLFGDAAWSVYIVNELTFRQRVAPGDISGRVNAAMQIASQGMLPLGALAGGFLASSFGIPLTLWISAGGVASSCLWLLMPQDGGLEFTTLQQRD